jgi:phosphoribosyl 1,2-cyclic phosphodiesterase
MLRVRFWGVRGSIPTPGQDTVGVGGNTSCLEVRCGSRLIVFDGGTGLRLLGNTLMKELPVHAAMFFSHVHWDHIQGFPFFTPAFVRGSRFDIYGGKNLSSTLSETLNGQMNFPNFPVTLDQMAATMVFHLFDDGQLVELGDGVTVRGLLQNHPDGSYGYRLEHDGKVIAYCTDTEHRAEPDAHVLELAKGADVFIYDAQYTPAEYSGEADKISKVGWGHSTYVQAAELARLAGVARVVLFHHDPSQSDAAVAEKERLCRELFPRADAAREGMTIEL